MKLLRRSIQRYSLLQNWIKGLWSSFSKFCLTLTFVIVSLKNILNLLYCLSCFTKITFLFNCIIICRFSTYFKSVISPGPKLELAVLIIEGEPCDVNLARGLEYPRGDIQHWPVRGGNNVGLECSIKSFISTETIGSHNI